MRYNLGCRTDPATPLHPDDMAIAIALVGAHGGHILRRTAFQLAVDLPEAAASRVAEQLPGWDIERSQRSNPL